MSRDHVLNLYCPNGRKQIKPLNICLRFLGVYVTMALFVSAAVVFHGDRPSAQKPSKGFAESVGSVGGWWGLRQVLCKAREGRGAYRTQLLFLFVIFFVVICFSQKPYSILFHTRMARFRGGHSICLHNEHGGLLDWGGGHNKTGTSIKKKKKNPPSQTQPTTPPEKKLKPAFCRALYRSQLESHQ